MSAYKDDFYSRQVKYKLTSRMVKSVYNENCQIANRLKNNWNIKRDPILQPHINVSNFFNAQTVTEQPKPRGYVTNYLDRIEKSKQLEVSSLKKL